MSANFAISFQDDDCLGSGDIRFAGDDLPEACSVGSWEEWNSCSVTCNDGVDTGTRSRNRVCEENDECTCQDDVSETGSCPQEDMLPCTIIKNYKNNLFLFFSARLCFYC